MIMQLLHVEMNKILVLYIHNFFLPTPSLLLTFSKTTFGIILNTCHIFERYFIFLTDEESGKLLAHFYNSHQAPGSFSEMILFLVADCGHDEGFITVRCGNYVHICNFEK